jgi:Na+-driven multidrug efflux pump
MLTDGSTLWKKTINAFLPCFVLLFLQNLSRFIERICLCHYSLDALMGSMQAYAFLDLFQLPLVIFANTQSVFARKQSASQIGNLVWQVIWISLFSMLVIIPLSFLIDPLFFKEVGQGKIAKSYFEISILGSFLFPIAAIFSSFFSALQKKGLLLGNIVISTQLSIILNLLLIPYFGVAGAAYSSLISKLVFCLIFLGYFIHRSNRELYHTHDWKIDWQAIGDAFRTYNPRVVGQILTLLSWVCMTYWMAKKGDRYLATLAVGASLTFLLTFFSDSLRYALTPLMKKCLDAQDYKNVWKMLKTGLASSCLFSGFLALPFLLFPTSILHLFFSNGSSLLQNQLVPTIYWAWIWIFLCFLNDNILTFIFSFRNEIFYTKLRLWIYLGSILQAYVLIHRWNWEPNTFWAILCIECLISLSACSIRSYFLGKAYMKKLAAT